MSPIRSLTQLRTLASGLDHPEAVAASPDGILYAGGEAGQIYRIANDGSVEIVAQQPGGSILGVALDARDAIYACDCGTGAVLRVGDRGTIERYCERASGQPLRTPNWAAFSSDGALWLSDSGSEDPGLRDGRLIRIPPGGGEGEILDLPPLHFPNGLCVAPDDTVYVLETFTPRLSRLDGDGLHVIVDLPGCTPDGLALQADGGFVVACYYPFQLLTVTPAARLRTLLVDPIGVTLPMPTNIAHTGIARDQLVVALLGGSELKEFPAPAAGAPLHRP